MKGTAKLLGILCVFIAITFIIACKKNAAVSNPCTSVPTSCASVSIDSAGVGKPIVFTSCSLGATYHIWNFGDNTVSNKDTVSHIYYVPGTYTVTYTDSNACGHGVTKTFSIKVMATSYWTIKGKTFYSSDEHKDSSRYNSADNYELNTQPWSSLYSLDSVPNLIEVYFTGLAPGVNSLIDTVYANGNTANHITQILVVLSRNQYFSFNSNQTITAFKTPNGKITVTGDSIKLIDFPFSDTTTVSFHLSF